MNCDRRTFLKNTALAVAGASALGPRRALAAELPTPTAAKLPRWKGFNLLEKFIAEHSGPFRESDFALVAEWGFNFVRLPMSYHCWSRPDPQKWLEMDERVLQEIDQAVEFGRQYSVHVNLNLHRAPGYCVNPPPEPLDLWNDPKALEAACHHWASLARRYKGIPNSRVSFDLLNEPPRITEDDYAPVLRGLVSAIRAEDPDRLIIADGIEYGRLPVATFAELKIGGSTRGYDPFPLSHWHAGWVKGSDKWPEPKWPFDDGRQKWDKARLHAERVAPWQKLEAQGVGVHVGEWGCYNRTPHATALAWMQDHLAVWREAGWGWALWNLRGEFGLLDSNRKDVRYEAFRGHQLDRAMLEVLRADLRG